MMLGFLSAVLGIISILFVTTRFIYMLISLFARKRTPDYAFAYHDYALLICARNEETVIKDLLDSIHAQTYPADHYEIFVIADNCSDGTAEIARKNGAIVYVRNNDQQIGKGYALKELLEHIAADQDDRFSGYLVIDADNILKKDYLEQMNIAYCQGNRIIAGYINSKNYGSNWISAGYSLCLLRKNRFLNNPRNILGLSSAINGTGFLFSKEYVKEWRYHTLTEDIEFSVDQVIRNNRIAYCDQAILYDEQPTSWCQSFFQRLRWSRGYLQVIRKYAGGLIKGMMRGDLSCVDMFITVIAAYGITVSSVLLYGATLFYLLCVRADLLPFISVLFNGFIRSYLCLYLTGLLTVILEWKRIDATSGKKILYTFTFPLFMATYIPIAICAIFMKVTWVPIRHEITV